MRTQHACWHNTHAGTTRMLAKHAGATRTLALHACISHMLAPQGQILKMNLQQTGENTYFHGRKSCNSHRVVTSNVIHDWVPA
eukprot:scaffold9943_cov22-Tisochrysis_lutea.AAC.1